MIRIAGQTGVRPAAGFARVDVPDFFLDRTEVTVEAYAECVGAGACDPVDFEHEGCANRRGDAADMPVTCVSYVQADQFCRHDGKRLPTPAELYIVAKAMAVHTCKDAVIGNVDGNACGRTGPSAVGSTLPSQLALTSGGRARRSGTVHSLDRSENRTNRRCETFTAAIVPLYGRIGGVEYRGEHASGLTRMARRSGRPWWRRARLPWLPAG